jgi:glycerophosphoryl diester phosphodiesterase
VLFRHAYAQTLKRPAHVSHRGGAKVEPENTLRAFERAVREFHTDVLELDVHRSSDGVIVVHHDATVDRCTDGRGPVAGFSFEALQALDAGHRFSVDGGQTFPRRGLGVRIPSLEQVLDACPGVRINLEVKPDEPGFEAQLAALLRRMGAVGRVCLGSESDVVAARLVEALPEACHFFPREALTGFVMAALGGDDTTPDPRFHVADMPATYEGLSLITPALMQAARRHGIAVLVWTIDDEAQMRALLDVGVDGIMTDRPEVLRRVIG